MTPSLFHRLDIRQRILLLTLIPLLLISLVLGSYFIYTRLQDTERHLTEHGELLARLMASSTEFIYLTNNNAELKKISKGTFMEQGVEDAIFLNDELKLLLRNAQFPFDPYKVTRQPLFKSEGKWFFSQPIKRTGLSVVDNPEYQNTEALEDVIGWAVVVISDAEKVAQERQIVITSCALLFVGFLITFLMARRLGKQISTPVLELTEAMQRIQAGDQHYRLGKQYSAEFSDLAEGLNKLADAVQKSLENQAIRIDLSTRKLTATLRHLEQQNEALAKARQHADDANKAKDDFLARMSHELRTPLTSVVGFARLLSQTPCTADQLQHIRIINQTAQMLMSIIDDILDFSKLQENAIALERISFNLEESIHSVLEMQAPHAHDKGLELLVNLPAKANTRVVGDPTRLTQIIANLVSNAIKFTEKGHINITLGVERINSQQSLFSIYVSDTGIGIPKDHLDQLFQAFMQADTSITRRFGGSGLGLVISKKLAELMGGKLSMHSEVNQGTQVEVSIPLRMSEQTRNLLKRAPELDRPLLYFDQDPAVAESTLHLFSSSRDNIKVTHDLDEFLALAEHYDVALVGIPVDRFSEPKVSHALASVKPKTRLICLAPCGYELPSHLTNAVATPKPARPEKLLELLAQSPTPQERTTPQPMIRRTVRVLIAEDNEYNQLLISKILNAHHMETITANNGLEAIQLAESEAPDLVLMDVHMPVMDGLEATTRIRQILPKLPIIALTANVIESEHLSLYNAGVSKVLLKPINDKQLIKHIETTVSRTQEQERDRPKHLDHLENTPAAPVLDVAKYDLKDQLVEELLRLANQLEAAVIRTDKIALRETNHQLAGLAGLYELPEVECCTADIHTIVHATPVDWPELWKLSWRLKRLLKGSDEAIVGHINERFEGTEMES